MIEILKGKIVRIDEKGIVLDVMGIGFFLFLTKKTLEKLKLGTESTFLTHLAIKKDGFEIYGFESEMERKIFYSLLSVQNVGERSAMSILSGLGYDRLIKALEKGSTEDFLKIKGIGEKIAKRIVLELKGKMPTTTVLPEDAVKGLMKLGYTRKEAEDGVKKIVSNNPLLSPEDVIKEVLSQ